MADATQALESLADALDRLKQRLAPTDPRKKGVNRLLLAIGDKLGGTASSAQIGRLEASRGEIDKLPGQGNFATVLQDAEDAVDAVSGP